MQTRESLHISGFINHAWQRSGIKYLLREIEIQINLLVCQSDSLPVCQSDSLPVCQSASCPSCPPPHCKLSKYEACLVVRLMIRYYDSDVEGLEVSADMTNVILMFHPLDPLRPLSWNTLDDFYNWILRFCSGNKRSAPVLHIWQEISSLA